MQWTTCEKIPTSLNLLLRNFSASKVQTNSATGALPRIHHLAVFRCRRGRTSTSPSGRPIEIRHNSPTQIASTSADTRTATSPLVWAFTPVPECRSHAWKHRSRSANWCNVSDGLSVQALSCVADAPASGVFFSIRFFWDSKTKQHGGGSNRSRVPEAPVHADSAGSEGGRLLFGL